MTGQYAVTTRPHYSCHDDGGRADAAGRRLQRYGLKGDRAVLSKERIEFGIIQSSSGIIAK
jgi:hypothetical protein